MMKHERRTPASWRGKVLAAAMLGALPSAPAATPADEATLAQRLQACTACHGREGRASSSGYWPRIAGKPAGYLFNQLVNFRDGRRSNAQMQHLVQYMTDDYLREIADHFAALDLPYAPAVPAAAPAAVLQRGERLARDGDAARGLPACSTCHGARLTGVQAAMPGLVGLPRDYLVGQLGAWRERARRAAAPDCMAEVALRLAPADIEAVTSWLAAQPTGGDMAPAAAHAAPLPIACGSGGP